MNAVVRWLKRWMSDELETRLTSDQAVDIACRHLAIDSHQFRVGAVAIREGRHVLWRVVTNVGTRGGHSQVLIDDASGEVVRTHHVDV